jgi:low affinity Fe/Cu permease
MRRIGPVFTGANNAFVNVEALSLEELERLREHYEQFAGKARAQSLAK